MLGSPRKSNGECASKKLGVDFVRDRSLPVDMDEDARHLIDRLGSELANVMEEASVAAALIRSVPLGDLGATIEALACAANECQALVGAMRVLIWRNAE